MWQEVAVYSIGIITVIYALKKIVYFFRSLQNKKEHRCTGCTGCSSSTKLPS